VPRTSSSHLNFHSGLIALDWAGRALVILESAPVLRATPIKASFMSPAFWKRSLGLYCRLVLTTNSSSEETF
jgi:hypothetical protein